MKVTETFLKGCFVIEPKVFGDKRGNFFEVFSQKIFEEKTGLKIEFVQDNQSISQRGVLRGLHLQKGKFAQAKLVRVIKGSVLDVAVDVRKNSPTYGKHFSIELSEENNKQLFVPRGFLHGFSTLEDNTIFSYKCDNYYHKEAEDGVIFNDKDLNINWKLEKDDILLSEKDKILPTFLEFKKLK
ncbi:dTDP-4-dehydrorhamnose 3,5-epimerase [Polaribacter haliotis]|uniref:dTDP-4-dehydrorhamnose 3,5-epimerase n=1 Tax=Polaribacter haliotis TaxID=1888915 RepID=A0A7L8ACH1_9FLAO|nr:dTDP-4-dehydrorhamnose 3,5-epimerase [Polaribacter haliotis]QOD59681.1 dTDP-4-dehydrorhamnose 3,5-epimerase [Polaribacter haliotis]